VTEKQLANSRQRLEAFTEGMLAPLGRSERRHGGPVYVRGLLLDGERKSVGAMIPRLPGGNEQALQPFVSQSPWLWEPIWEKLAASARQQEGEAFWIIDDTSFPPKGEHSVGVPRQYCGALGKLANCQVAASLHQSGPTGSRPLAWRLYLPETWTQDPARRKAAGIPDDLAFHKKWELALELLDQARAWGLPDRPVLADADYGDRGECRAGLEQRARLIVCGRHPQFTGSLGATAAPARTSPTWSGSDPETPALCKPSPRIGQSLGPAERRPLPPGDLAGRNERRDEVPVLGPAGADGASLAVRAAAGQNRVALGGVAYR
jgi:SRSO17 transposase